MKVYGFDIVDVMRGELQAAQVDKCDMDYPEQIAGELGWEFISSKFREAKAELIQQMTDEGVDPERISLARGMRTSDIWHDHS